MNRFVTVLTTDPTVGTSAVVIADIDETRPEVFVNDMDGIVEWVVRDVPLRDAQILADRVSAERGLPRSPD